MTMAQDNRRAHWPKDLQEDIDSNTMSGVVGSVLVSETD
jgi:hypothetical protein